MKKQNWKFLLRMGEYLLFALIWMYPLQTLIIGFSLMMVVAGVLALLHAACYQFLLLFYKIPEGEVVTEGHTSSDTISELFYAYFQQKRKIYDTVLSLHIHSFFL